MNKFKAKMFKIAKTRVTYWIILAFSTILIVGFYLYVRNSAFL